MPTPEPVLQTRPDPRLVLLTLNRPEARNALDTPTLARLAERLEAAEADPAVRAVVLAGGAQVFAAGADLRELSSKGPLEALLDARVRHWQRIAAFPKPLLAAVEGWCLGGGNELALCADLIVAGKGARFGQPEVGLGLIPGGGATCRLTALVGKGRAMRMILTGQPITAEEAERAGLVALLVEAGEAQARALELAATIAERAPLAVRLAKEAVLRAASPGLADGLAHERKAFALLFASEDLREGIRAFLDKRSPVFHGR